MSSLVTTSRGGASAEARHLTRPSLPVIAALFCGCLSVGLPLPVLPLFIHAKLGFDSFVVGIVVGIQFLATVLTRGYAGRVTDQQGGRRSALQGAFFCAMGGLLYMAAAMPSLSAAASLALVVIGRVSAGLGESQFVTGCVSWSLASVGPKRAGMSMSWTGMAVFGAVAIGAPFGIELYQRFGLQGVTVACVAAPLLAAMVAFGATPFTSPAGQRLPFHRVVGQIWREGFGLFLHAIGLAGLSAFSSLFFASHAWVGAGWVMTAYAVGFIGVRVVFGHLPDQVGGYRVAIWSFAVEAIGQAMVWLAPNEYVAFAGALVTGLGCALIFPALGVELLKRVLPANRGSAMGAFVAFMDIAYGVAGPAAGWLSVNFGYSSVYVLGSACALVGAVLALQISATES